MNPLRYALPILFLAACGGVDPQSDSPAGASVGTAEQRLLGDDCTVNYVIENQFADRFDAEVSVTNQGAAGDGWEVTWRFLEGERIFLVFDGEIVQNGANVTARSSTSNGELGTGDSASVGFTALSGDPSQPADFGCTIFR